MITREETTKEILGFLNRIKQEAGLDVEVSEDTAIIGGDSHFDSMTFLDLMGMIEDWIDERFNLFISVASEDEDFAPDGPFGNVRRLSVHLADLINRETADR